MVLPGFTTPGQRTRSGCAQRFLEDPALVEPAVLAQIEALIGRVDDDGVAGKTVVVEEFEQPAHAFVDGLHAAQVVVHVALVFPADEIAAVERGRAEGGVARLVVGVPGAALFGRQDRWEGSA